MADPLLLVVIVLPGSLLIQRVGGASTNLSVADLLVFVGGVVCLFHVRWSQAPYLRRFLRGIVWYQAILILVVMAHPFRDDIVEWFHRFSYLGGSVLVGWVIATHGRTHQAFRLFLWGIVDPGHHRHGARGDLALPAGPVGRVPEEPHRGHHVGGRGDRPDQPALGRDRPGRRPG